MRRLIILAGMLAITAPALAVDDVPLSPLGLSFQPITPQPVPPGHPLFHTILLEPVTDMPNVVGASATAGVMGVAKRSSFENGLHETFDKLNMLAPTEAEAKFRLTPRWIRLEAPFRISLSSRATARLSWTLTRIDNGQQIFQQEIATSAESSGGYAVSRAIGVGRVALMANIASAAACLDKAVYGQTPDDCALVPLFTYQAPTPTVSIRR
jgi:hypothetical protein